MLNISSYILYTEMPPVAEFAGIQGSSEFLRIQVTELGTFFCRSPDRKQRRANFDQYFRHRSPFAQRRNFAETRIYCGAISVWGSD